MSTNIPDMNPTIIPSFFPRINPKDDVTIIKRLGVTLPNVNLWNIVLSNKKHAKIIAKVTIFRFKIIPPINQPLLR